MRVEFRKIARQIAFRRRVDIAICAENIFMRAEKFPPQSRNRAVYIAQCEPGARCVAPTALGIKGDLFPSPDGLGYRLPRLRR